MCLLPYVEATSDPHSYGFRPYRGCWDANAQIRTLLDKPTSPTWVLNADIETCFDTINHDWLLSNTPVETKVLKSWLKAGYIESSELFPTEDGTPQGGVISPTLANLTINGLEQHLKTQFKPSDVRVDGKRHRHSTGIHVVRYADNFLVTGKSKRQLERVQKVIDQWLSTRGLKINPQKTKIRSVYQGFDFLGWNFRRYPSAFLCKISKQSLANHRRELKYLTKTIHSPESLITSINTKIRGWMNYHCCCNNIWQAWGSMDHYLYTCLMKWCQKRHSNKTKKWIFDRYWKRTNGRWTFTVSTNTKTYVLTHYALRQKRIRTRLQNINVFDKKNKKKIRQVQLAKKTKLSFQKARIWKRQRVALGTIPQPRTNSLDLHHVVPRKNGGTDKPSNLMLMHEHCHYETHHGKLTS